MRTVTALQLLQSGWRAPVRSLIIGMLGAFAVSLPVIVGLNMLFSASPPIVTIVAGVVQALTTFTIAGWLELGRRLE